MIAAPPVKERNAGTTERSAGGAATSGRSGRPVPPDEASDRSASTSTSTSTSQSQSQSNRNDANADWASSLDRLSRAPIPDDQFFRESLATLRDALGLATAVLWRPTPQGLFVPIAEVGLADSGLLHSAEASRLNLHRLGEVLRGGQSASHPATTEAGRRRCELALAPIVSERGVVGVLECLRGSDAADGDESVRREVASPPDGQETSGPTFATTFAATVDEAARLISRSVRWRDEASSPERQLEFSRRLETVSMALHGRASSRAVAFVVVNEGRTLLGCDRVSLVVRHGRSLRVAAVTGQERVHSRSNLVRAMARIAGPVMRTGASAQYPESGDGTRSAMRDALSEFLQQSGARSVKIVPLGDLGSRRPDDRRGNDENNRGTAGPRASRGVEPFAALIVEHFTEDWLTPLTAARTEWLGEHAALALANARRTERIFLLPVVRALGESLGRLRGARFFLALLLLTLVGGVAALLVTQPATYRVEGRGRLMPMVRRDVFAPWDGEVVRVAVEAGERVSAGDVLLTIRSDELDSQLLSARNRLLERQQALHGLRAESDEAAARSRPDDVLRLRGRLAQAKIEVDGLAERVASLETQAESLTVRAPIDGTVATFHVERMLLNRPVRRGERLIELMDERGDWRIEAQVPETRAGHLLTALDASRGRRLRAEFVLATRPEATFAATLADVATRTSVDDQDGLVVPVTLALDADQPPERRIGADAAVKIDCGEKPLGYVLFGDLIEFVQRKLW